MINLDTHELARVLGIEDHALDRVAIDGVTIDSRGDCANKLFVAIRGSNFDGHSFVDAARANGAVAALVEKQQDLAIPQLRVEDSVVAMGQLANYWRRQCDPRVIALTGSNGKTTVKEMLFRILSQQASTHATRGNFNNDIGVPLTLFALGPEHEYAIIEMGANHRGEIARLAEIAEPDIVYVNNVAAAHLSGFGDVQGVVEAKGELYAYCGPEQQALFNLDEVASDYWRKLCAAETQLGCALDNAADVSASWETLEDGVRIEFAFAEKTRACELRVLGEHNVRNALAAVSLAVLAGIDFILAVDSLGGFSGVDGRLQILSGPARSRLIDDSYNANPGSLEAGVKVVCAMPGEAWLALGDMGELGEDAAELHREAARTARRHGVKKLFGVGELSCIASDEFGEAGHCFGAIDEMAAAILAQIHARVNLLVKGSRAAGMERLIELLTRSVNGGDTNAV